MDTLKAIHVFIEVAERQSFTQTAEYLDLSRAMTSRYIDHLESVFNVRLLHRNTRKVSVTTAGEKALIHCHEILKQQQQLEDLSSQNQVQGTIRITVGLFLFQLYFKDVLQAFRQVYPQVQFDLFITEDIVDLYQNRIDFAFRISQKFSEGLIAYPLKEIKSDFCVSADFLQKVGEIESPKQLMEMPCIVHDAVGKNGTWALSQNHQSQNYHLQTAYRCNEILVLYQLCLAGQGIAMLPSDLVKDDIANGTLISVLSNYQAPVYELCMLYSSRQHLPKIMQLFSTFIKQHFNRDTMMF